LQQNPQALAPSVLSRYSESYARYEAEREADFLDLARKALRDLGFFSWRNSYRAAHGAAPKLLDVGCATGALIASLSSEGHMAEGIEPCEESAAIARGRGLKIHRGTIEGFLAARPGRFGAIIASHVIEHVNDPASFLRAVRELLEPDGRIFLTTPDAEGLQARLAGDAWRSAIRDHLYLFGRSQLRRLAEGAGLEIERARSWGGIGVGARFGAGFLGRRGVSLAPLKPAADRVAKLLDIGDVMALRLRFAR
jgi:SAM-dependent methyltransferase